MTKSSLSEVVSRYVTAGMPIASANLQPGELIGLPAGRWKSTGAGHFQREDAVQVSWVAAISHREDRLHALPEYQDAVALIESNEEWRRQFGTLVGTWQSRGRLDMAWFLDGCLGDVLSASTEGRDPLAAAVERAEGIERLLNASELNVETFGPLLGLNAFGVGRVELNPTLVLDPISEADVERLFKVGLLVPMMPQFPFVSAPSHMVRSSYRTPKVVGEVDTSPPSSVVDEARRADEAIEDLLVCLRLFKPGMVAVGGTVTAMPGPFGGYQFSGGGGHQIFLGRMPLPSPHGYALDASEVDGLAELWHQLHSPGVRKTRQLALAARRFAYKGERTRVDDQLVDLVVAAEALFLGDSDEESRGELRFRLSSRAASYIVDPSRGKRAIFRVFMAAYKMRSRLVHGGDVKALTLDGMELTPERMVESIEGLLRLALKQALRQASELAGRLTIDWEALLFPA